MTTHRTLSQRQPRLHGWFAFLLSGWGVLFFWVAFGVVHAALRLYVSRSLSLDDARSNELVQEFALGYQNQQPPLYEWILWCVQQFLGTGIESQLFVRYSLIAAIGLACYGAVRAALKDDRWAAAASLSLAASYPVGWSFHDWATQTILLCIACFVTMHAAINWLEKPSARAALWLGAAIGIGLLAKFSYLLFLGGLLVACFSMREIRFSLADRRLLLAAAVALLMISPYLFWLHEVQADTAAAIMQKLIPDSNPYIARVFKGLVRLAKSVPLFLLPWLAFVALLAPQAFAFGKRAPRNAGTAEILALRTMVAALALTAIGIVSIGVTNIAERYMHAMLIVAPVYVFARVARFDPRKLSLRPIAVLAMSVALIVVGVRVVAESDNFLTKQAARFWQIPYPLFAAALKERGIDHGTIVTHDVRDAGNLRSFLPEIRVIASNSLRVLRPRMHPGDDNSCVWLYRDAGLDSSETAMPGAGPPERIEVSGQTAWFAAPRRSVWFVSKLDPKSPPCR